MAMLRKCLLLVMITLTLSGCDPLDIIPFID